MLVRSPGHGAPAQCRTAPGLSCLAHRTARGALAARPHSRVARGPVSRQPPCGRAYQSRLRPPCWGDDRGARARGCLGHENPSGIALCIHERCEALGKASLLDWLTLGPAAHTADPALGGENDLPIRFPCHRARIDSAQISLHRRVTLVFEQILQRLRIALRSAGGSLIVEKNRRAEFIHDEQQLGFFLALCFEMPNQAQCGEAKAN